MSIQAPYSATREQRIASLVQCDYDTSRLDPLQVDFDFSTDSWGQLKLPYMAARMDILKQRAMQHPLDIKQVLAQHFPFRHLITTPRGRDAEGLLFTALAKPNTKVIQNILFHTARGHQQRNGMLSAEIPHQQAFTDDACPFKGNLDLDKLEQLLDTKTVSMVFIEALSNAVGGHPISMENLRSVRTLAHLHSVPLYMDATRAVENCVLIREREIEFKGRDLSDIMQEFYACCDGVTVSLVKDYGVTVGGLLATNSDEVYHQAHDLACNANLILDNSEHTQLAQAIDDWEYVETQVQARIQQVKMLGVALQHAGFPVRLPVGGHAVILDLGRLNNADKNTGSEVASYLTGLYEHTGMRGAQHWGGTTPRYRRPLWIRLAVPLGFSAMDTLVSGLDPAGEHMFCTEQV